MAKLQGSGTQSVGNSPQGVDVAEAARTVAVVTGAATGIGRAIALELGGRGYDVIAAGLELDDLRLTAQMVEARGGRSVAVEADVTKPEALAVVSKVALKLGGARVLVNNAAVFPAVEWEEITEDEWDRVLAVNLKGAFFACRALASQLRAAGGSVINISSTTAFRGSTGFLHYVCSKGALIALTRSLAREMGEGGVRVNSVAPGAIPTRAEAVHLDRESYSAWVVQNQCLKYRGSPEDVANVVAFLAGGDSSFMTGQTLVVDGGWQMN